MKRGESGLSMLLGIRKPCGITSHDVVSRVRRVVGERRVGHMGTLDPAASGVLIVGVGPAARLDAYVVGHDKTYEVQVAFGAATATDDAEGEIIEEMPVPDKLLDEAFAQEFLSTLLGRTMQMPPLYSAIKKGGQKACDVARKGGSLELEPREVEFKELQLLGIDEPSENNPYVSWRIRAKVSKGTYIRSFARDLGQALFTVAHVRSLSRITSGSVSLFDCSELDALGAGGRLPVLDPVRVLGCRFAFVPEELSTLVRNGGAVRPGDLELFEPLSPLYGEDDCCTPCLRKSEKEPCEEEFICLLVENKLAAMYRFRDGFWRCDCVFNVPVVRGELEL